MVYINENSHIVEFPRASKMIIDKLVLTNQTSKHAIIIEVADTYVVDMTEYINLFVVGQYDYEFKYLETTVSTGILQFGEYTPTNETYKTKRNIIQYTPN